MTLGYFPAMQLASARTLHAEHLALLPGGIDPKILRWQEKCNT
nr:Arm DNA-binding domain-containing protein [Salmonella enterica]